METQIVKTAFGPICTNKKFYKNLMFKKKILVMIYFSWVSTRHLTLQEDHDVSVYGLFLFWASGPKYGNQLQAPPPPPKKK